MTIRIAFAALVAVSLAACDSKTSNPATPPFPKQTTISASMTSGTAGGSTSAARPLDAHPDVKAIPVKVSVKFEPAFIAAKKGEPIALEFTRTTEKTCAKEVIFDDLGGLMAVLPLNTPVRVSFTPEKSGEMVFGCGMGRMISGKVAVQ